MWAAAAQGLISFFPRKKEHIRNAPKGTCSSSRRTPESILIEVFSTTLGAPQSRDKHEGEVARVEGEARYPGIAV
jgi:hypothetical protein